MDEKLVDKAKDFAVIMHKGQYRKNGQEYIKHPSEVVSVGDIVDCYVDEIHMDKNKVSLSLIK